MFRMLGRVLPRRPRLYLSGRTPASGSQCGRRPRASWRVRPGSTCPVSAGEASTSGIVVRQPAAMYYLVKV